MKKEEIEKQVTIILEKVNALEERCKIELATANFLREEADKLISRYNNENIGYEEKNNLSKQMESLYVRIQREIRSFEKSVAELDEVENEFDKLRSELKNME